MKPTMWEHPPGAINQIPGSAKISVRPPKIHKKFILILGRYQSHPLLRRQGHQNRRRKVHR